MLSCNYRIKFYSGKTMKNISINVKVMIAAAQIGAGCSGCVASYYYEQESIDQGYRD